MNYFDIKNEIDKLMYSGFNLISETLFFFKYKTKKLVEKNQEYKDIHKGQRCFILGTGPSLNKLTELQIEKLRNETTFGVNALFRADIVKSITPKYYSMIDDIFWRDKSFYSFGDVHNVYDDKPIFITDYRSQRLISKLKLEKETIFLHCMKYPINKVSDDISKNMVVGINVVSYTIYVAIYLGFKEIYLLGSDYNSFATFVDEHCYEEKGKIEEPEQRLGLLLNFYSRATEIHYLITKLAKKKGVKIINITPGSLLDAYPRKDISTVL